VEADAAVDRVTRGLSRCDVPEDPSPMEMNGSVWKSVLEHNKPHPIAFEE